MPNNKVTYGLKNVYYSKATEGTDGKWTFTTPVTLPGAQEFTNDIVGGSTNVNADDQIILSLSQLAGRTLTLKLTELTDEFKVDILGYKKLTNGNIVEITNAQPVTFALGFEIQGDLKARRIWFYLCSVTPINESSKTKADSIEVNAITLNITSKPIAINSKYSTTHVTSCLGDANYETFLTVAPVVPTIEE